MKRCLLRGLLFDSFACLKSGNVPWWLLGVDSSVHFFRLLGLLRICWMMLAFYFVG